MGRNGQQVRALPLQRTAAWRRRAASRALPPLRVAGLFAGVGGIELGLERAGHETVLLCENDPGACEVLEARFPGVELVEDTAAGLAGAADAVAWAWCAAVVLAEAFLTAAASASTEGLVSSSTPSLRISPLKKNLLG